MHMGEATQWLRGAVAPAKMFFFPLDYEEKINRPPQHYTAGPPHPFLTHSPSPQSKIRNTLKLKFKKKEKIVTEPNPQQAQQITKVACSRQAHGFSTKKKKKSIQRIRNETHHFAGREMKPITSLAEKSNPNTVYTEQTKTNSSKPNTEVFIKKKKKIPNTQTKTKPQQTKPSNPRSRRCSSLVIVVVARRLALHRRSQILDRRSQIALPLLRCLVLPPALP